MHCSAAPNHSLLNCFLGCALFWCSVPLCAPFISSLPEFYFIMIFIMVVLTIVGITFAVYGVACVQLVHSSVGNWSDIFVTHIIIIIKSKVSNFPIIVIFSVSVCMRWLYYHLLPSVTYLYISRGYRDFVADIDVQSMVYANDRIVSFRSCSFVCKLHHFIIIIMWTCLKAFNN